MGTTKVKAGVKEKLKEKKGEKPKRIEKPRELRTLVRFANTDLDGEKKLINAIRGVKGISYTLAKAIISVSGFDPYIKLGSLTEKDIGKLESIIKEPTKYGIPSYLVNRRKDLATGKDIHLTGSDLDIAKKFDIQRDVDLKTWRGFRHILGQPVRGQRTRSTSRTAGRAVGVVRKAVRLQMQKSAEEEKKEKK